MKTRITELLNVKHPVVQGGMAWVANSSLVSAVANAGGAGIIGAGSMPPEVLRAEIRKTRELTKNNFGVNIQMAAEFKAANLQVAIEEKLSFVATGGGDPRWAIEPLKKAGIKFIPVVPDLRNALKMESLGADAVVLEGMEAGGHIGYFSTMSFLSAIVPKLKVPVIIGGGFLDGRGLAAALLMGADAIQMGSAFMVCEEMDCSPKTKEAVLKAAITVVTGHTRGDGMRGLPNAFTDAYFKKELDNKVPTSELNILGTGKYKLGTYDGDVENGSVAVGQIVIALEKMTTCKELIESTVAEAERILKNAPSLVRE